MRFPFFPPRDIIQRDRCRITKNTPSVSIKYRGREFPWYHLNLPHSHDCGLFKCLTTLLSCDGNTRRSLHIQRTSVRSSENVFSALLNHRLTPADGSLKMLQADTIFSSTPFALSKKDINSLSLLRSDVKSYLQNSAKIEIHSLFKRRYNENRRCHFLGNADNFYIILTIPHLSTSNLDTPAPIFPSLCFSP